MPQAMLSNLDCSLTSTSTQIPRLRCGGPGLARSSTSDLLQKHLPLSAPPPPVLGLHGDNMQTGWNLAHHHSLQEKQTHMDELAD